MDPTKTGLYSAYRRLSAAVITVTMRQVVTDRDDDAAAWLIDPDAARPWFARAGLDYDKLYPELVAFVASPPRRLPVVGKWRR